MVAHLLGRKGRRQIALIPPEVLDALNAGRLPTRQAFNGSSRWTCRD